MRTSTPEAGEALTAWRVQQVRGLMYRRHTETPPLDALLRLPEAAVRPPERHRIVVNGQRLAGVEMREDLDPVITTRLGEPDRLQPT